MPSPTLTPPTLIPPIAPRARRTSKATDPALADRARQIVSREIDYIHNPEFERSDANAVILGDPEAAAESNRRPKRPPGLPAYLAGLYEVPLLTPKQEAALFRQMNYLRFLANRVRSRIDPRRPAVSRLDEFDRLIAEAEAVRNRIARCNLRLVVSIARKFADRDNPFDDFVSDGNMALLQAVAKFDYGRGFRFSTYATHAVRRAFYRQVQQKRRRKTRMVLGAGELIDETADAHESRPVGEGQYRDFRGLIDQMADRLDPREREILTARFGLDIAGRGMTLQEVAKQMGICKERVRQIQNRAIDKLRGLAAELGIVPEDDPSAWG